jgi:hypothetical protein
VNRIDTILNIAWALLSIGALLWQWRRERQRARPLGRRAPCLRVISVFLAGLLLFPCISISDDYARARLLDLNSAPTHPVFRDGNDTSLMLAVQLEEAAHLRPVAPFVMVLVLCCLLGILSDDSRIRHSFHWDTSGRAPPGL